jgi:hypothetical protein
MSDKKLHPIFQKRARPIYDIDPDADLENVESDASAEDAEGAISSPDGFTSDEDPESVTSDDVAPVPTKPTKSAPTRRVITSDEKFWNEVDKLYWRDRSDSVMQIAGVQNSLKSKYSTEDLETYRAYLRKYMDDLKTMMVEGGQNGDILSDRILSHIVGKGQLFYAAVSDDPDFAMYLIVDDEDNDAQDLWSVFEKII